MFRRPQGSPRPPQREGSRYQGRRARDTKAGAFVMSGWGSIFGDDGDLGMGHLWEFGYRLPVLGPESSRCYLFCVSASSGYHDTGCHMMLGKHFFIWLGYSF